METQCCRCCLTTESENFYNLFENYNNTRTYAENIHQLAEVDVELDDGLPQYACGKCFIELRNAIQFVLTIRQSNEKLKSHLQETPDQHNVKKDEEIEHTHFALGEESVYYGEGQEHISNLEEEVLHSADEPFHPPTEVTIVEEYVKEDSTEDLQMVEEILEYDEEIPNDTVAKEIDPLHELAHIAATQENVHVDPNSQEFFTYAEDECDNDYLIEYDPKEEPYLNLKPSKWKCMECNIILRGDVSYEGHMNIHRNTRPHKCTQCSCQFRCRNAFKKHKEVRHAKHKPKEDSKVEAISIVQMKCSDCNQKCQTEASLLIHEIIVHDKHSQTTSCPLCQDVIVENLLNHLQSEHLDVSETSQDEGEATKTLLETMPCVTISFYNCHLCSKRFNSLLALNNHRNSSHNADRAQVVSSPSQITSWHCDICSEAYDTLSALNEHWRLSHDEDNTDALVMEEFDEYSNPQESLVQCEICKKKLQKKNLSKHMAVHKRKDKETIEQSQSKLLCAFCPSTPSTAPTMRSCKIVPFSAFVPESIYKFRFKRHLDRVHHASMTDDALSEMFQRNTGKTIKIEQVSDSYMVASPDCVDIEEEIV